MLCNGKMQASIVSEFRGFKPKKPKEVFGADVTGPHHISPSGWKYCLEEVCFYSGYGYSFPLRKKSDAIQRLKDLIQRLHNAECYPSRIQVYVSDHGGETIMSTDFQNFLQDHGIFWQSGPLEELT